MTKSTWRKTIIAGTSCLVPNCRDAEDWLAKTKLSQGVLLDPRRPRNIQHHRKLFALLNLAIDNWPEIPEAPSVTTKSLLGLIKLRTGYADPIMSADGIEWIPRSINFESMDQQEFEPFYDKAIELIALALGVNPETLDSEVI